MRCFCPSVPTEPLAVTTVLEMLAHEEVVGGGSPEQYLAAARAAVNGEEQARAAE
jgi:hypothetical protein